jgi:hypothetical protein
VDVGAAIDDLLEVSRDVRAVVVADGDRVVGTTLPAATAAAVATVARALVAEAERVQPGHDGGVRSVEASFRDACVFVVLEGERIAAATTGCAPAGRVVLHDLGSLVRAPAAELAAAGAPA